MNVGIGLSVSNFSSVPTVGLDLDAAIAALFSSGEEGAWYDPSDLTTLYQDAAGSTPVTGTGQPVGLMLDKSKGLTLGSELVTNGTFDTDTDWTKFNATISGGQATMTTGYVQQGGLGLVAGRKYKMTWDVVSTTSSTMRVYCGTTGSVAGSIVDITTGAGSYSAILTASTVGDFVRFSGGNGTTVYDNISVRELPGNHATQSTSTARPTLQLSGSSYYLDFDGVDDYLVAQYSTTLSNITRGVAYRADADNGFVCDDYDNVNYCSLTIMPTSSNLRFGVNGAGFGQNVVGVGGWVLGDDEVAVATALSTSALALQGSGNSASGTSSSAPANINGVTLGAAATGLLELNGRIYGFVDVSRGLDAAEIASLETYLATKSGVTLP